MDEFLVVKPKIGDGEQEPSDDMFAVYSLKYLHRFQAMLSLIQTLYICCVLGLSVYGLSKITNTLLINPIEQMVYRVQRITENPLKAAQESEERDLLQEMK